jgi:hypothetical protein
VPCYPAAFQVYPLQVLMGRQFTIAQHGSPKFEPFAKKQLQVQPELLQQFVEHTPHWRVGGTGYVQELNASWWIWCVWASAPFAILCCWGHGRHTGSSQVDLSQLRRPCSTQRLSNSHACQPSVCGRLSQGHSPTCQPTAVCGTHDGVDRYRSCIAGVLFVQLIGTLSYAHL